MDNGVLALRLLMRQLYPEIKRFKLRGRINRLVPLICSSALGHERRFGSVSVISGLPQEADVKPVFRFEARPGLLMR
jgi:hypothetical protein